jgi:hypothetical protein
LRGDVFGSIGGGEVVCFVSDYIPGDGATVAVVVDVEFVTLPLEFSLAETHNYFSVLGEGFEVVIGSNSNVLSMPMEAVLSPLMRLN